MSTTTSPHSFAPLMPWDRWHKNGRCRNCIVPKQGHPVPLWIAVRFVGDRRYYSVDEVTSAVEDSLARSGR